MPESNAAKVRRMQKNNRLNGIGDENGRLIRQKDPPKLMKCSICQHELKITKTNTELTVHAASKHNVTDIEVCFPGATQISKEMIDAITKNTASGGGSKGAAAGTTKGSSSSKKQSSSALDDLLSAGLSGGIGAKQKKTNVAVSNIAPVAATK